VFQRIEDIRRANALLGSNTSTLPITVGHRREASGGLSGSLLQPRGQEPLVEIIKGEKTSDEALGPGCCSTTPGEQEDPDSGQRQSWLLHSRVSAPS
jgi:hypothetical protein